MRLILVVAALLTTQPVFAQVQFVSEPTKPRPLQAPPAAITFDEPAVSAPAVCQPGMVCAPLPAPPPDGVTYRRYAVPEYRQGPVRRAANFLRRPFGR